MRALICGGGIAGLALAYWLERIDIEPVVIDKAHAFHPLGHYIGLKGNGVGVIRQMGLEAACRAREARFERTQMLTAGGRLLRFGTPTEFDQALGGYIFFRRSDLHAALFDAVRDRVDVRYGVELAAVDGQEVVLSNGVAERFDFVFGADGVHSKTRQLVFGDGFTVPLGGHYLGLTIDGPHGLDTRYMRCYFGRGQTVMLAPTSPERLSAIVYHGDGGVPLEGRDTHAIKRVLTTGYGMFAPEVRAVFERIGEHDYVFADVIAQVRMPNIVKGRVALLGDAAHCPTFMSGMGSALALQDARTLSACLARRPDETGLAEYQARVSPVAARYQQSALRMRPLVLDRRSAVVAARNLAMRLTPNWLLERQMRQFYQAEERAT